MDYQHNTPERYWIVHPRTHYANISELLSCGKCDASLEYDKALPVKNHVGGLCISCATADVSDHPVTPTYLNWLRSGDPRWWSAWTCNCEGCVKNDEVD